tara:strand:+ start:2990 stop:4522 length:1533 start_codon:yes stop_codon:yes gene_type:complete
LALTSAFFVSADDTSIYDLNDLKSPDQDMQYCALVFGAKGCAEDLKSAYLNACNAYKDTRGLPSNTSSMKYVRQECFFQGSEPLPRLKIYGNSRCYACEGGWGPTEVVSYPNLSFSGQTEDINYICPPASFPKHIGFVPFDPVPDAGPPFMCAKLLEEEPEKDCPAGYHSKAVSKAMGSDSCMPKECPASGSGEDLYSGKMAGGVPFDGGGMYCNDGCAYSVKSENITSDQYALGISQGAACGDKPYDDKKLSEEGDEGQCETNTVDGVTIMFCNNEPAPPTDKDDDANNDGSKEDETEKPKKDLEDCASDDNACMLRNLIKEQSNNTQVQIENDNKLHNKMVDTATNNTNILKTAIDDLHTTVFVGLQKNDKLEAVKASKMNDLISAVREGNQILTDKPIGGGGGNGGGNGGGDGEGEGGGDCEGGAADCVPIAGSEIPKEIVNLSQYADKYDDWLPNAELPDEKCIVLTTGQSLCFSFSAFIILFQAISGLIVISSLLHSARIIAGAI